MGNSMFKTWHLAILLLLFSSCDHSYGILIECENINISIKDIYETLNDKLNYDRMYYGEEYDNIQIFFDYFSINIYYYNDNKNKIFCIDSLVMNNSDFFEEKRIRINEIKYCLLDAYPQYFSINDFHEKIYK
jgi:hypothetical protein